MFDEAAARGGSARRPERDGGSSCSMTNSTSQWSDWRMKLTSPAGMFASRRARLQLGAFDVGAEFERVPMAPSQLPVPLNPASCRIVSSGCGCSRRAAAPFFRAATSSARLCTSSLRGRRPVGRQRRIREERKPMVEST